MDFRTGTNNWRVALKCNVEAARGFVSFVGQYWVSILWHGLAFFFFCHSTVLRTDVAIYDCFLVPSDGLSVLFQIKPGVFFILYYWFPDRHRYIHFFFSFKPEKPENIHAVLAECSADSADITYQSLFQLNC